MQNVTTGNVVLVLAIHAVDESTRAPCTLRRAPLVGVLLKATSIRHAVGSGSMTCDDEHAHRSFLQSRLCVFVQPL